MSKKAENTASDIFDCSAIPMIVCNSDFIITQANISATDFFGYHLLNIKLSDILDEETLDELQDVKNLKKPVQSTVTIINNKEETVTLIANKNQNLWILSIIPSEFCSKNQANLNQAHLDFISTVSHELRTPLTSIKGFTETLITSGSKLDDISKQRFLQIIKSQIERLTRLVENLLSVTKLEAQKSPNVFKSIVLSQFLKDLLLYLKPKTANHKITLNINPKLPEIWVDTDKLEQILTNLIDNAVKYSNENTEIIINADFSHNEKDTACISIKDNGFGIPQEHLTSIFNKFSRIDNPLTRGVQGTGLGLYITKSLIESINGSITVTSNETGSTFTVNLPISNYETQAQQHFQQKKD